VCSSDLIEISITGGKANALEEQRVRHGQIDYLQGRAIAQANALKTLPILAQGAIVGIRRIVLAAENYGIGRDEPAQVVHVAMGIVPFNSLPQPEGLLDPQKLSKDLFHFLPAHARVADLRGIVQKAFLGGEKRSLSVAVDRSAFVAAATPMAEFSH